MALGEVLNLVIGHVYMLQGKKRLQTTDIRDFRFRISSYEINQVTQNDVILPITNLTIFTKYLLISF